MDAPSSHLVRRLGPVVTALAATVGGEWYVNGTARLAQNLTQITPSEVAMFGALVALAYLIGAILYSLYRAIIYLQILKLRDLIFTNTARRDILERYMPASGDRPIGSAQADYLFRMVMSNTPHDARRMELADSVHFLYQSGLILQLFVVISVVKGYLGLSGFYLLTGLILLAIGLLTDNYLESEERLVVKINSEKFDEMARTLGLRQRPDPPGVSDAASGVLPE